MDLKQWNENTQQVYIKTLLGLSFSITITKYIDTLDIIKEKIAENYRQFYGVSVINGIPIIKDNISWLVGGDNVIELSEDLFKKLNDVGTTHVILNRTETKYRRDFIAKNQQMHIFIEKYNNYNKINTILTNTSQVDIENEKKRLHTLLHNKYLKYTDISDDAVILLHDNKQILNDYLKYKHDLKTAYKTAGKNIWDVINSDIKTIISNTMPHNFNYLLDMPYVYNYIIIKGLEAYLYSLNETNKLFMVDGIDITHLQQDNDSLTAKINAIKELLKFGSDDGVEFKTLYTTLSITDKCDTYIYDLCIQLMKRVA